MKSIRKKFTNLGHSKGIVLDKVLLKESDLDNVDEVQLVCGKEKILIRKSLSKEEKCDIDKWDALKRYLIETLIEKRNSPKYFKLHDVLEKMLELEKENDDER